MSRCDELELMYREVPPPHEETDRLGSSVVVSGEHRTALALPVSPYAASAFHTSNAFNHPSAGLCAETRSYQCSYRYLAGLLYINMRLDLHGDPFVW